MFIPYEMFTVDCSGVRGLITLGYVWPHRFHAFRLHLCFLCFLDFKRLDFAFSVFSSDIRRSDFASARLLQIRRSDIIFIWIRCSDFICITFTSTEVQMFKLRLLEIMRSNFAFIWIRCSKFICIILSSTADVCSDFVFYKSGMQTSSSVDQAFKLCLHMDQMFGLHLHHFC